MSNHERNAIRVTTALNNHIKPPARVRAKARCAATPIRRVHPIVAVRRGCSVRLPATWQSSRDKPAQSRRADNRCRQYGAVARVTILRVDTWRSRSEVAQEGGGGRSYRKIAPVADATTRSELAGASGSNSRPLPRSRFLIGSRPGTIQPEYFRERARYGSAATRRARRESRRCPRSARGAMPPI